MGKIEEYKEQSKITRKIMCDLNRAQGLNEVGDPDPHNDKHDIGFYEHRIWDSDIPVWLHASYGYYGSSNGYTACSPELQSYLIKALNHYKMDIVNYIVEQAKHDSHISLLKCKTEAEQILKEIDGIMINNTK